MNADVGTHGDEGEDGGGVGGSGGGGGGGSSGGGASSWWRGGCLVALGVLVVLVGLGL